MYLVPVLNIMLRELPKLLVDRAQKADAEKRQYIAKLEEATGEDVFKYLLLMNTAALEDYVAQTRLQAQQSFRLSSAISVIGFLLLGVGIALGFYLGTTGKDLDSAYLASAAGVLTEFISGVFFYLFNKTLQQLNRFHDKLITSQHISLSFMATSQLSEAAKRDAQKAELAKLLMVGRGSE